MGRLRIGVHRDVEVTDVQEGPPRLVSQAFCSALPVAYSVGIPVGLWEDFATLVLKGAYESTLAAASLNAARGVSRKVVLTSLGGGVFGNEQAWILEAIEYALDRFSHVDLDVRLVSYTAPNSALLDLVARHAPQGEP